MALNERSAMRESRIDGCDDGADGSRGTVLQAGQNFHVRGGSDKYLIELCKLCERIGYRAIPFAARHALNLPTPWDAFFPGRVSFSAPRFRDVLGYLYSTDAARMLESLLREVSVDLAHLHIYYGQLTGAIIPVLRRREIPIVQTLHEYKAVCPTYTLTCGGTSCERCRGLAYYRALAVRCNRDSILRTMLSVSEAYVTRMVGGLSAIDKFIAVSHAQKRKLVEMGLQEERIEVIHNFVDCERIVPAQKVGDYFLFFGRLEIVKGIYTLLRAVRALTDARLEVVGSGAEAAGVRKYLSDHGLANVMVRDFVGAEEMGRLLAGCRCAIVPSEWYEPFGLTALEAMAHGKPVIASAIGGLTEIVQDEVTGFLFPPGDSRALEEKMRWLLESDETVRKMGAAARGIAEGRFGSRVHAERIRRMYASLI